MDAPTIQFPCDYPIKVIGDATPEFTTQILDVMLKYDSSLCADKVRERASRKGNYQAITVLFWAMSADHVQRMFVELKACPGVRLVL